MAIPHAQPGEAIDISPLGSRLQGEKSIALFKSNDLEVLRLVLPAGGTMPPHKVDGEITIQCIEGRVNVTVDGAAQELRPSQLLFLKGGVVHAVEALEDAQALVTIVVRKG